MNANSFQSLDGKSTKTFDGKSRFFCGPAKNLRRPVPVCGPAVEMTATVLHQSYVTQHSLCLHWSAIVPLCFHLL